MVRRYGLRDDQWEQREHVLPGREATVGVTAKDTRLFGEAVMYRYRAGIPWRDLPERFGDGKTHHRRHRRGSESRYGKERSRLWRRMPTTKMPGSTPRVSGPTRPAPAQKGGPGNGMPRAPQRRANDQPPCCRRCAGQSDRLSSDTRTGKRPGRSRCLVASSSRKHAGVPGRQSV